MLKNNKKMMSKMKNLPNDPKNGLAYLQKMLDEPNAYTIIGAENVINPIILLLFANINGNHKFHFSRETIGEHHFFFWFQKYGPFCVVSFSWMVAILIFVFLSISLVPLKLRS